MIAEIISIGDELLIGQVINSNQASLARHLNAIGIFADRMTTVGDDREAILTAFRLAVETHDIVTVTGGLGPTHDDITRAVVCEFFGTDLVLHEETLTFIRQMFDRRKIPLTARNEDQARVPRACTVIPNHLGTAPGYLFEQAGKSFIVMPGVPFEMEGMMNSFVIPHLAQRSGGTVIRHHTLKTTGIPESMLADRIGDIGALFSPDEGASLAFLPSPQGVRLRITVRHSSAETADALVTRIATAIREKAGKYIYAVDEEELEEVLGKLLSQHGMTIAIAESCTGGLIADRLTNVPGSSTYFERGIIAYSNECKIEQLGIPRAQIETHGAVSREVAEAMASGVRSLAHSDIGLSTTGIAGPGGGTPAKPVGLVWIGYSDAQKTLAVQFNFGNDRRRVKERAAQAALELARRELGMRM